MLIALQANLHCVPDDNSGIRLWSSTPCRTGQVPRCALAEQRSWPEGWFGPRPVPRRITDVRPVPAISGRIPDLEAATSYLERFAHNRGVWIGEFDGEVVFGVACYDQEKERIVLHRDLCRDPALHAFALAHELAHHLDPQFRHFGEQYTERRRRVRFEVVAEAAAIQSAPLFAAPMSASKVR